MPDRMNPTIKELTAAVEQEARKRPEVLRLMDKQLKTLNPKLRGHYQYYGRPTNSRSLWRFYKWSAKSGRSGSVPELAGRN